MRLSRTGRLAALVPALCTSLAFAQESAPIQSVQITGSSEAYDPRRDDTASKIVISQAELAKYGDPSVADALKRVPGVTVVTNGRGIDIRMRGLGAGYTRILVNGERAPMGLSLDSLSPAQVERIEVLRSASAEYTTESIAGTINVVLKKAVSKTQREIQLNAEKDAIDRTARSLLQLEDKSGAFSWTLSARTRHTWIDRDADTVEEAPVLYRKTAAQQRVRMALFNAIPRLQWQLAPGSQLVLQAYYNSIRSRYDSDEATQTSLGTPPGYPLLNQHAESENTQWKTDLVWSHRLERGSRLELKASRQNGSTDGTLQRLGYALAPALDNTVHTRTSNPGFSSAAKYVETLSDGHALAAGFEGSELTRRESRIERELLDPAFTGSDEYSSARTRRVALFAQDEWTVTPKLSVYAGARMESLRTAASGSSFDASRSRARIWSPILQTLYKLRPEAGDQLRFALTRTFKAPDTEDLVPRRIRSVDNTASNPDSRGNPGLQPELATGIDASYEYYWAKGAMLSAAVSFRRIGNATVNRTILEEDGRWVSIPFNAGEARVRSLELEARFPLRTLLPHAPAMDIKASLARNWSSVDSIPGPDNRLAQQIPLSATFSVDRSSGHFSSGASFVFREGGWTRRSLLESSYRAPRRELDVYGLWKIDAQSQLRIFLGNLLRSDELSARRYADVNRSIFNQGYVRLRLSLEQKF